MAGSENKDAKKGFGIMHAGMAVSGMAVCCAVMLIPVAGFFVAGGTIAGLGSNLAVFAPIALCIGVHVLMFAVMGKSCHGKSEKPAEDASFEDADPVPVTVASSRT